ncbi:MAG: hypothetical protein KBT33_00285 [Prevotellaceae bacterium]|nr:hypothetical protein [Candidatus Minthosoma equi]
MKKFIYIIGVLLTGLFVACSEEDVLGGNTLTAEQEALIGRAVNFNASYADAFTTRVSNYTNIIDGSFNQNDRMRIYRNYYEGTAWSNNEAYRTYAYVYKSDATTGIDLGHDWQVEVGRTGYDDKGEGYKTFPQSKADSLTWENGKTIRFRAWSQSNYHNILYGTTNTYFYPDFCASDYVNASGPSTSIPMVLRHLGTRIMFKALPDGPGGGNEFHDIRLCSNINPDGTENPDGWKDYKYADNADTNENDGSSSEESKEDDQAKQECDAVTAVFKRMCMPAGVDITTGTLKAVKNEWWKNASSDQVRTLEDQAPSNFYSFNTTSAEDLAKYAKRPFFCTINYNPMMVTIPYDMSNDATTSGEVLTLPACTRFRIYMRDVNNGDEYNKTGYEGKYHIFALSDIMKTENGQDVPAFPDGLKLGSGLSYTFRVGYRYGGLYVTVDNNISWVEQDLGEQEAANAVVTPTPSSEPYKWWQDAIRYAIPQGTNDFQPVFHIENETQFLEFIKLVNGTTGAKTGNLYLLDSGEKDSYGNPIKKWSTVNSVYKPNWVTEEDMAAQGYLFYDHYHAANADRAAYSERDYLKGPYPFYDDNLSRNFTVKLDEDLDLQDWMLESIGASEDTPFRGCFDGQGHTIKNVYMKDENIFGYVNGIGTEHAAITNLKIESLHNTCLIGTGVNQIYVAGIALYAPSSTNSIAHSMSMDSNTSGTSYVVGCIHVGDARGALVGTASNLNMFGCMQAAQGITGGALIGTDANTTPVFTPQISLNGQKAGSKINAKPQFKNFIGNFYDTQLSPSAKAVGSTSDDYSLLEYIRGRNTDILCAKNDYLTSEVSMKQLLTLSYTQYYGLAPWKVMNYAIYWYNKNRVNAQVNHPCTIHYENNTTGYVHRYPVPMTGKPEDKYSTVSSWNPVEQTN